MAKKKVHRFGEVCRLLDVQPYVLRYWETEFPVLASSDESVTQRTYTDGDLAVVQRIKELLYSESFTLVGAKKKLQAELDEGKLKLTTMPESDTEEEEEPEAAAATAEPAVSADDEPEEEPEPAKKAKTRPVSKKTAAKKRAAKKRAASDTADDSADGGPSVDLAELEAILGDARELLEELRG